MRILRKPMADFSDGVLARLERLLSILDEHAEKRVARGSCQDFFAL